MRTDDHVRALSASELGLGIPARRPRRASRSLLECEIGEDDARLRQARQLFDDGFGGVILTGPPGTSKTWYAAQIAARLADRDPRRVRFIQFHPSYQYEDFVQGYAPKKEGGFELRDKHLVIMCQKARDVGRKLCVLVIDELSRCDPSRVFGEALTYIEMRKREEPFTLASGAELSIPPNLVFLATMNPLDRGVDDVDAAMERRFAKIAMEPDESKLLTFLSDNGVADALANRVLQFFRYLQRHRNAHAKVGHSYFINVKDQASLRRLWDHQLKFYLEKAFQLNPADFGDIERAWNRIFEDASPPSE